MVERRKFTRLPAEAEVQIKSVPQGAAAEGGRSKNISGNGILLSSKDRFELGTVLDIEVTTPTHKSFINVFEPLRARIKVVRVDGQKPPFDIAGEFIQIGR